MSCVILWVLSVVCIYRWFVFFQAEDGIRYLVRSRGLGDVYKRQGLLGRGALGCPDRQLDQGQEGARRQAVPDALQQLSLIHI